MQIFEAIKSDLYRYTRSSDIVTLCRQYLTNRGFNYMVWHRIAQSDNSVVCRIARLFLSLKMRKFGIQIPVETSIGLGFYIGHGGPCVVHHTATIGNNCNISQYVTIGATLGKSASIGDEVYIGPNVCIVEEVTIGSRSLIGAGAVVTRDIPAGSTAVGVPARPIDKARQHNFITNRWPSAM
ncbi:serine acetyltransferase [Mesorhizobium australicum]|jgi:serine O-acetyltransferase|uniref:Serine acetyltransferase n=1 Tax=Mesorhizobium australicum TaxID=536018 RepID=A0ACC6T4X6_9HYPH|nr:MULTISPECIES: serine acetyltransferase [unclassified Mesorhizobium]ESY84300.1 serine acetyltransferase [Mesorhizobium sp. LNHC220B00]ESY92821.1 serine acetyltransferase [Mesorhizobium sp. LNHC229A00]ESY92969.1 serine acetyltransferase [Mesorhizobium sp. LNHC209A00]